MMNEAERLFMEMQTKGYEPNAYTYTSLLRGYHLIGQPKKAESMILEMQSRGVKPNTVTYTAMMRGYTLSGNSEQVYVWYQKMRQANVMPNHVTLGTLLSACSASGDMKLATEYLCEFRTLGLKPDVSTMNTLIKAAIKARNLPLVERIFHQISRQGLKKSQITYNMMINAYAELCSDVDPEYALNAGIQQKDAIIADGLKCDQRTYNGLIKLFLRLNDMNGSLEIFQEMKKSDVEPDVFTYTSLISGYAKYGKRMPKSEVFIGCISLLAEMKEREIECNLHTLNALLNLAVTLENHNLAVRSFEYMKQNGVEPDGVTFGTMMNSCAKHSTELNSRLYLERCFGYLDEMRQYDIPLSCEMVSVLLWACARACNMKAAQELLRQAEEEHLVLNDVVYNSLIKVHLSVNDINRALDCKHRMEAEGYQPCCYVYNSLLGWYSKNNYIDKAKMAFREMRSRGIEGDYITHQLLRQMRILYE